LKASEIKTKLSLVVVVAVNLQLYHFRSVLPNAPILTSFEAFLVYILRIVNFI